MNPLAPSEAKKLFAGVKKVVAKLKRTKVVVCPPAVFLPFFAEAKGGLSLGAQDLFTEKVGAYTGALSAEMLGYVGAKYAIIGHSEVRARGDNNEVVNKKVKAALRAGLKVILCVGELVRDESGEYLDFLRLELESALAGLPRRLFGQIIVAYEPVWAIGKSAAESATPADFLEKKLFLRKLLVGLAGKPEAAAVPILYGGSVEEKNALDFLQAGEADGLLVGHTSLRADKFSELLTLVDHGRN